MELFSAALKFSVGPSCRNTIWLCITNWHKNRIMASLRLKKQEEPSGREKLMQSSCKRLEVLLYLQLLSWSQKAQTKGIPWEPIKLSVGACLSSILLYPVLLFVYTSPAQGSQRASSWKLLASLYLLDHGFGHLFSDKGKPMLTFTSLAERLCAVQNIAAESPLYWYCDCKDVFLSKLAITKRFEKVAQAATYALFWRCPSANL